MFSNFKTSCKNFLLKLQLHRVFYFLVRPSLLLSNTLKFSKWISDNKTEKNKKYLNFLYREDLYQFVNENNISNQPLLYLEFGVFKGDSIKWWLSCNNNIESAFYGFDTFEGLPESWGDYKKGDFDATIPNISDTRVQFVKGLFQDTLPGFLGQLNSNKKIIVHIDADLFSSTLYVLTTLRPFLKKDDIILFDEFFVPNDEFSAFEIFCRSFYIKYELLGATNNYFRVAIKLTN